MKRGRLQCKDIPDGPILEFLEGLDHRGNWCFGDDGDVHRAMPVGIDDSLVLAKMEMLMRRGLVRGCCCGCRGDFELTQKGDDWLADRREERWRESCIAIPKRGQPIPIMTWQEWLDAN